LASVFQAVVTLPDIALSQASVIYIQTF